MRCQGVLRGGGEGGAELDRRHRVSFAILRRLHVVSRNRCRLHVVCFVGKGEGVELFVFVWCLMTYVMLLVPTLDGLVGVIQ